MNLNPYSLRPGHRSITRTKLVFGREPTPVGHPTPITWSVIYADGQEETITGAIWSAAPPISGDRSVWAISDHADRLPIRVAIVGRSHQVGRRDQRGRWNRSGGRVVFPGEVYTETDHRSPTGAATSFARAITPMQASRIEVPALPDHVYRLLSTQPK